MIGFKVKWTNKTHPNWFIKKNDDASINNQLLDLWILGPSKSYDSLVIIGGKFGEMTRIHVVGSYLPICLVYLHQPPLKSERPPSEAETSRFGPWTSPWKWQIRPGPVAWFHAVFGDMARQNGRWYAATDCALVKSKVPKYQTTCPNYIYISISNGLEFRV